MTDPQVSGSAAAAPDGDDAALPALSGWSRFILALLALGSAALAAMSFAGMFDAVRDAMQKWFGGDAWMIPVGTDLGIVLTSAFSVFFEAKGMALWWLRPVTLAFVGLQLGLNVGAAHGDPLGSAGHAVLPLLFLTIIETWTYFIRKRRNLIHKNKNRERIPFARYLADWRGSRDLRRRMILWDITRYTEALDMRQQVLRAEAGLGEIYGPKWRKTAPQDLVMMLNTSKYLDEACREIARALERHRRERDTRRAGEAPAPQRTPAAANSGPAAENSARPAAGIRKCCAIHTLIDTNSKRPERDPEKRFSAAKVLWAEHVQAHGEQPGAETLNKVLTIGGGPARELRDQLIKWHAQSGSRSATGSGGQSATGSGRGAEGAVGPESGSGHANGSVVTAGRGN